MAKDLHKDDLENFFKDSFDEQSDLPSENGWDVPSDRVWEQVEPSIKTSDIVITGVNWRGYFIRGMLLLVLFTIGIAAAFYFTKEKSEEIEQDNHSTEDRVLNQDQKTNIDQSLVNQDEKLNNNKELSTNKESDLPTEALVETNSGSNKSAEKIVSTDEDKTSKVKAEPQTLNKNKQPNPSSQNNKSEDDLKIETKTTNTSSKNTPEKILPKQKAKSKDIASSSNQQASTPNSNLPKGIDDNSTVSDESATPIASVETSFDVLSPLPTKGGLTEIQSNVLDSIALPDNPFFDFDNPKKTSLKNNGFYIGISLAPTYTYRQLKSKRSIILPVDINKNEMAQFSFSAGVNLGYKFSKNWSIESGFNYSQLVLQHRGRKQIRYTTIGEQVNDRGEFERNYNFDLGTSSGEVNTDVALAREAGTNIPENEFISLRIKARQNIQYGSIPIVLRYQFGERKLQFGLKAGIVNKFVLDGAFKIEEIQTARGGIRLVLNDRIYRSRPLRNIKNYQADFLIGAGISYAINNKIWFTVEPTLTRSINPLFENQNFKTFPAIASLDLGLNYKF